MSHNILRIDSSARRNASVTRRLSNQMIKVLSQNTPTSITVRDVSEGVPFVNADWVNANFTDADARTDAQKETLAESDTLIGELKAADTVVIGMPIYNFGIPATLKAWIDMIARARVTFKYTENGPVGLLKGKRAFVLMASGGVPLASDVDFASPYIRQALRFVGIEDVTIIAADRLSSAEDIEAEITKAVNTIKTLNA